MSWSRKGFEHSVYSVCDALKDFDHTVVADEWTTPAEQDMCFIVELHVDLGRGDVIGGVKHHLAHRRSVHGNHSVAETAEHDATKAEACARLVARRSRAECESDTSIAAREEVLTNATGANTDILHPPDRADYWNDPVFVGVVDLCEHHEGVHTLLGRTEVSRLHLLNDAPIAIGYTNQALSDCLAEFCLAVANGENQITALRMISRQRAEVVDQDIQCAPRVMREVTNLQAPRGWNRIPEMCGVHDPDAIRLNSRSGIDAEGLRIESLVDGTLERVEVVESPVQFQNRVAGRRHAAQRITSRHVGPRRQPFGSCLMTPTNPRCRNTYQRSGPRANLAAAKEAGVGQFSGWISNGPRGPILGSPTSFGIGGVPPLSPHSSG